MVRGQGHVGTGGRKRKMGGQFPEVETEKKAAKSVMNDISGSKTWAWKKVL